MNQPTIAGYPRIGNKRQLKRATEKYFAGTINKFELEKQAKQIRAKQWKYQKASGLSYIPSNDFSYYDLMLDTAFMLNAIPQEYKDLGLDELDTYFACARGYQGKEGDVKALAMRKWFNTNYHYIVPRIKSPKEIKLIGNKPFEMYEEALDLEIKTKPVLIGPFTFLKLSVLECNIDDYIANITAAYTEIISKLASLGAEWIQIDEPYLVSDLTDEDISTFVNIYSKLLKNKKSSKILLNTYFGDIRDIYSKVMDMDFDGYGLDFVEGKKSLSLIQEKGFAKSKVLFSGIINGRNIWKNDYSASIELLNKIENNVNKEDIIISTSCSLLHVPYSLESETTLDEAKKAYFAFAKEKVVEAIELASLFNDNNYINRKEYIKNIEIHNSRNNFLNKHKTNYDFSRFARKPEFKEREKVQRSKYKLPLLPMTTIGSFPQISEIKKLRRDHKKGLLTKNDYDAEIYKKIAKCIKLQENLELDVLVHGEYERNDMVEYFGENLDGFLFTQNGWVQSYGTRCVKPPIIFSDIKRKQPITVEYSKYAQSLTNKPVKGMLTGPVTILNWSFPRSDISKVDIAFQIAEAIKLEVLDLEACDINIIQIDEAALKEKLPIRKSEWYDEYLIWAIPAFRAVHFELSPETQVHTHMCYSNFEEILSYIDDMDADVISFEAARSDLSILSVISGSGFKTQVGPGVYDIHSPRVPKKEELEVIITKMLEFIPKSKLWINPDCGLKTRGEKETKESLKNMINATKSVRKLL